MKHLIANWKSHKTAPQVTQWVESFMQEARELLLPVESEVQLTIAPAMPHLSLLHSALATHVDQANKPHIQLAVQDVSPYPFGSYTGAVAADSLKGMPVQYAIVGHSERREYFHETYQEIANKVDQALSAGIIPIVCVDDEYISEQVAAIPDEHRKKCIVAFEERNAIGSGDAVDTDVVEAVIEQIREQFSPRAVLYGGSVDASNIATYCEISDGVLVGSASLDAKQFARLVQRAQ